MNFNEYQKAAHKTAIYPEVSLERLEKTNNPAVSLVNTYSLKWVYPLLGLANESGEVLGKAKKLLRDNEGIGSSGVIDAIGKELGDVLWYLAETCTVFGLDLQQIAEANIAKLQSRQERGILKGDGDNR